jgi:PTS system nitrogen regulatory IIA component
MKIGDLIDRNQVIELVVSNKKQLLQELARRSAAVLSLDQRIILDRLQARETLGSTGFGKGFALPHARLNPRSEPFTRFIRLARPIDWASIDECPVDLVVLLLTSADADSQHLATLAALSRALRDKAFLQRLRRAPDVAALHVLLSNT